MQRKIFVFTYKTYEYLELSPVHTVSIAPIRINTESNDLRKIKCLRKSEAPVEEISVCDVSLKNWRSMTYTVSHAPMPMTSQIC